MGQTKKCCICTKYFWARRKKNKICTKYFLGQVKKCNICKISQSEFTHQNLLDLRAFLQLPLYFCTLVLGQAKKCCICTKYFWARRKNTEFALSTFWDRRKKCKICKKSQSEFTHQNLFDLRHFYSFHCTFAKLFWVRRKSAVFAPSTFGSGDKIQNLH